jgi:hypothetical protein
MYASISWFIPTSSQAGFDGQNWHNWVDAQHRPIKKSGPTADIPASLLRM